MGSAGEECGMGVMRRLWRLLRANKLPLTEEELERALVQLHDDIGMRLAQARVEVAACAAEERRLSAQLRDEEQRAAQMETRARLALRDGQEGLAWEAMREHLHAAKQAEQSHELWRRQSEGTQRLQALLAALENKFADIEHRRQLLQAYQQLMRAHHALVTVLSDGAGEALIEHAEEAMVTKEFIAEAYRELSEHRLTLHHEEPDVALADRIHAALAHLRAELAH